MSGTPGFIYVLSNPSMPGMVKIGRSSRHPSERVSELFKNSSGVPQPFVLEFAIYVKENHEEFEMIIHESLGYCRVNRSREFFKVEVDIAVRAISSEYLSSLYSLIVCDDSEYMDISDTAKYARVLGAHPIEIKDCFLYATLSEVEALLNRARSARDRFRSHHDSLHDPRDKGGLRHE